MHNGELLKANKAEREANHKFDRTKSKKNECKNE